MERLLALIENLADQPGQFADAGPPAAPPPRRIDPLGRDDAHEPARAMGRWRGAEHARRHEAARARGAAAPRRAARSAHRAVEPPGVRAVRREGLRTSRSRRLDARAAVRGPRRVQAGQRHARPQPRRRGAHRGRRSASAAACAVARCWRDSAATSSPCSIERVSGARDAIEIADRIHATLTRPLDGPEGPLVPRRERRHRAERAGPAHLGRAAAGRRSRDVHRRSGPAVRAGSWPTRVAPSPAVAR